MSEYDVMDPAIAGLKYGLDNITESKRCGDAEGIPFGYPTFGNEGNDDDLFQYRNDRGKCVWDADFVTGNLIDITVNGVAVTQVAFNTDHDTTMDDIVAQIEADIAGADASLDSTDVNNRTIFVDIEGVDVVLTEAVTGGASQADGTITNESIQIFKGIAQFTQKEAAQRSELDGTVIDAASAQYDETETVNNMIQGWIYGEAAVAVNSGEQAYVVISGANQGKLTNVDTGVSLTGCVFDSTITAAGIVRVRINK